MGAEAIKELLKEVDLEKEVEEFTKELEDAQGQKRTKISKKIRLFRCILINLVINLNG